MIVLSLVTTNLKIKKPNGSYCAGANCLINNFFGSSFTETQLHNIILYYDYDQRSVIILVQSRDQYETYIFKRKITLLMWEIREQCMFLNYKVYTNEIILFYIILTIFTIILFPAFIILSFSVICILLCNPIDS